MAHQLEALVRAGRPVRDGPPSFAGRLISAGIYESDWPLGEWMIRFTLPSAAVLLLADMWAFWRMTRRLRESRPDVYERYFRAGTWFKFFDETDPSIWAFYKSSEGDDDGEVRRLKALSHALSWIAPLAALAVVASLYLD